MQERKFFSNFFQKYFQNNVKKFEIYEGKKRKIHRMHVMSWTPYLLLYIYYLN